MKIWFSTAFVLAGGLLTASVAANAAPITYDVDLTINNTSGVAVINPTDSATLTGTVMTDGTTGPLSLSNITGEDLTLTVKGVSSQVAFDFISGSSSTDGLIGSASSLSFLFGGGTASAELAGGFLQGSVYFNASADTDDGLATPSIFFIGPLGPNDFFPPSGTQLQPFGSTVIIGTAAGTGPVVSPVPLPASAPIFGAALAVLGVAGYGVRRQRAAGR